MGENDVDDTGSATDPLADEDCYRVLGPDGIPCRTRPCRICRTNDFVRSTATW